jgi:hypothetical protein
LGWEIAPFETWLASVNCELQQHECHTWIEPRGRNTKKIGNSHCTVCNLLIASALAARKYGKHFAETDLLAYQINDLLKPSETFHEWGSENGLYFTSRPPASGIALSTRLSPDLSRQTLATPASISGTQSTGVGGC